MVRRDTYPIATKLDAVHVNEFGEEFIELIGDEEGPYKYLTAYTEAMIVDRSASEGFSQWVDYELDGQTKRYQFETSDSFSTRVRIFKNAKGNHLLVISAARVA